MYIHSSLTKSAAARLTCSLINTCMDCCNSFLINTSAQSIARLQHVQNSLARIELQKGRRQSIKGHIQALHWLRVRKRLENKIVIQTFQCILFNDSNLSMHSFQLF